MSLPIIIKLTPNANNEPGRALFRLPKNWDGQKKPLYLTVKNNSTDQYLQNTQNTVNTWEASSCEWILTGFEEVKGQLQIQIGPDLVDPLLEASSQNPNFEISLRDETGYQRQGALMFHPDGPILPSTAKSLSGHPAATLAPHPAEVTVETTPQLDEPLVEPAIDTQAPAIADSVQPEPEPTSTPTPTPTTGSNNKKLILILLVLLALLAFIVAGAWWWMTKGSQSQSSAIPAAAACDPSQMGGQSDVEFIQACLKEKPDSQALLQVIDQAKAAGHCSIAQRLYANRSQSGDITIAMAYVKEYDPKFHKKSDCFPEPSVATAKYWYETILSNDPNNSEAKQRLDELN